MSRYERYFGFLALLPLALMSSPAQAEMRCDCTTITGSCNAQVSVKEDGVEITTDRKDCSRVDYYVDGQPLVTVAIDGKGKGDWLSANPDPHVVVTSCQVCRDNLVQPGARGTAASASTATPVEAGAGESEARQLTPLIKVAPAYPAAAVAGGVEGYVVVQFSVTPGGNVSNAQVKDASPRGVFEQAALTAVRRWRFQPSDGSREGLEERVEFRLADAPAVLSDAAANGRARIRNWCVKEGYEYELVDMVEVQLINACNDPVVLYTCNEGFGKNAGQWFCGFDASAAVALVRKGDPRNGLAGELATQRGKMRYAFVEETYVARPPSTRYWWIACNVSDLDCHEAALRWQRFMHLKPRAVDPRQSSDLTVTASS